MSLEMFTAMREGNPRQNTWISFNNYGVKFKPLSELRAQAVYIYIYIYIYIYTSFIFFKIYLFIDNMIMGSIDEW